MKNGITENYNDKNKSENKIKLIVHILFIENIIEKYPLPFLLYKIGRDF